MPGEIPPGEATALVGFAAAGLGLPLALLSVGGHWLTMPFEWLPWWVLIDAVRAAIWLLLIAASVHLLCRRRPGWLLHSVWAGCHVIWVPLPLVISPVVSPPPTPVVAMVLAMFTDPFGFVPAALIGLGYWLGLPLLLLAMLWFARRAASSRS